MFLAIENSATCAAALSVPVFFTLPSLLDVTGAVSSYTIQLQRRGGSKERSEVNPFPSTEK